MDAIREMIRGLGTVNGNPIDAGLLDVLSAMERQLQELEAANKRTADEVRELRHAHWEWFRAP